MCFTDDESSRLIEQQQRERELRVRGGIAQIDKAFAGFDPAFYDRQRNAVLAAQLPQLGEQYRQQGKQLGYSLANQGLLRSTAGSSLAANLQRELAQQQANVANQATQAVQGLQQQVGQSRGNLINQAIQSADPTLAAQQSAQAAQSFSAPSLVQPLGNLFQNWANIYLARQVGNAYSGGQPSIQYGQKSGFLAPNTPASAYTVK